MPSKPAPIKKAAKKEPAKKEKTPEPAPAPEPAPEPAPVAVPEPAPEAAPAPAEGAAAPAEGEAPAAPAEEAKPPADGEAPEAAAPEEPKPPTPPPPPPKEPTSAPLDLFVEDKNDTSVTIIWSQPEVVGSSGLDGYTIEICKDGTEEWKAVNEELQKSCRYVIKNQTTGDRLKIRVVAVNAGGRSPPVTLLEPVLVKEVAVIADRPKVRLPRFLRQRYVANVGDKINLTIPFTARQTQTCGELDKERGATGQKEGEHPQHRERQHPVHPFGGEGRLRNVRDVCEELPGPPASVKIVDTWGFNVALEWTPPTDNGNTEITGYTVQKADKKTGDWFTVLDHYHRLNATISDLIMGNTYKFRVFSENKCGMSEDATVTKEEAKIVKTGIDYKPPEYKEHDFSEAPKFTTSMIDRSTTVGYSTKLLCSVRGSPKPKVQWMKNQMIIGDDPKFRQICVQGICSLEIRKPSTFDGGVYTCKAMNAHGEAIVTCKLEVK
ncbi:unnamed protein product, partial [Tetraodon nigroviridis]